MVSADMVNKLKACGEGLTLTNMGGKSLWYTGPVNTSHGVSLWEHICDLSKFFGINIRIKGGNGNHARF